MHSLLIVLLLISGIIFIGSVMFMSPKGGLGIGLGGMSGAGEYGSKKSIESTLKKAAVVSSVIFVVIAIVYPFVG